MADPTMPERPRSEPRRFACRTRPQLALGGLAAVAGLSLTGCDGTPDLQDARFTTVSECVNAGMAEEVCQSGFNAAQLEHQRSAPQFNTLSSCEQDWGSNNCMPMSASNGAGYSSGGSVFVPMLTGFLISQALQQRYYSGRDIGYAYYGGGGYRGTPIYRDRGGSAVTVQRSGGKAIATPVNVNTTTVARSGFGGMGKSRSGFRFGG
jgi:uncharacterized protein YgiB involved in biofilm formation